MIRAYTKKPVKIKNLDYKKLLTVTLQKKYPSLFIGLFVSLIISSFTYRTFLKNVRVNLTLRFPSFVKEQKKPVKKIVAKKPLRTYVVQEGDDLWHISEQYYGSGFNAYDISQANSISDSSNISAGQKLVIPDVAPRQPTVGDISATSTSQVTYVENKYIVQPGDSLSIIAEKVYGDVFAWPRLLQANKLSRPDQIEAGMVLIIPR